MSDVIKTSRDDVLYAAVKAGLGSIPILGAAATELFGLVVTPPIDKRRQEWMNDVAEKLKELEKQKKIDFASLSGNDQFIDTIIQATSFALKTSETEKILAFKNAVFNTALDQAPDKSKSQMFLNLVDSFTVWHIRILYFFRNPKEWFAAQGQTPPNSVMGSMFTVLKKAYPQLAGEDELVDVIWKELGDVGFHRTSELKTTMTGEGALAERVTPLGNEFIKFISSYEE